MNRFNLFFEKRKGYGTLFLRMVVGIRLLAGVWPMVSHSESFSGTVSFFSSLNLPVPTASAYLAVYAEFLCGLLYVIGLWVRPAALIMIINFTVAILAAHVHDDIIKAFSAWAILGASFALLFSVAGKLSLDSLWHPDV